MIILITGLPGTGKTTLANNWPDPAYDKIHLDDWPKEGLKEAVGEAIKDRYNTLIEGCMGLRLLSNGFQPDLVIFLKEKFTKHNNPLDKPLLSVWERLNYQGVNAEIVKVPAKR